MSSELSRTTSKSVPAAVFLSMIVPGLGSLYTRHYGFGGFLVGSAFTILCIQFVTGWVPASVFAALWAVAIGHAAGTASR